MGHSFSTEIYEKRTASVDAFVRILRSFGGLIATTVAGLLITLAAISITGNINNVINLANQSPVAFRQMVLLPLLGGSVVLLGNL